MGQESGQRTGNRALLDHHALVQLRSVPFVDEAGDARPDRPEVILVAMAPTDPVHLAVTVVTESQHVTVAGHPLPDAIGERQAVGG
jgi:hypothetical protein